MALNVTHKETLQNSIDLQKMFKDHFTKQKSVEIWNSLLEGVTLLVIPSSEQ